MKASSGALFRVLAVATLLLTVGCLPITKNTIVIDGDVRRTEKTSSADDATPNYALNCKPSGEDTNRLFCSITETKHCTKTVAEETDQKQVTEKHIKGVYQLFEYLGGAGLVIAGGVTVGDAPNVPEENDPTTENPVGRNGAYAIGIGGIVVGAALFITGIVDSVRAKDEDIVLPSRSTEVSNNIYVCSEKTLLPDRASIESNDNRLDVSTDGPNGFPISIDMQKFASQFCPCNPSNRFFITSRDYEVDATETLKGYCNEKNEKQAEVKAFEAGKKKLELLNSYVIKGDFPNAYTIWNDFKPANKEQADANEAQRQKILDIGINYCNEMAKSGLTIDYEKLIEELESIGDGLPSSSSIAKCRNQLKQAKTKSERIAKQQEAIERKREVAEKKIKLKRMLDISTTDIERADLVIEIAEQLIENEQYSSTAPLQWFYAGYFLSMIEDSIMNPTQRAKAAKLNKKIAPAWPYENDEAKRLRTRQYENNGGPDQKVFERKATKIIHGLSDIAVKRFREEAAKDGALWCACYGCKEGYPPDGTSCFSLASLYERGCNGEEHGFVDPIACYQLAGMYYKGGEFPRNFSKAIELWSISCEGNYAKGCRELAKHR